MASRVNQEAVLLARSDDAPPTRVRQIAVLVAFELGSEAQVNQIAVLVLARPLPKVIFAEHQTEYRNG